MQSSYNSALSVFLLARPDAPTSFCILIHDERSEAVHRILGLLCGSDGGGGGGMTLLSCAEHECLVDMAQASRL